MKLGLVPVALSFVPFFNATGWRSVSFWACVGVFFLKFLWCVFNSYVVAAYPTEIRARADGCVQGLISVSKLLVPEAAAFFLAADSLGPSITFFAVSAVIASFVSAACLHVDTYDCELQDTVSTVAIKSNAEAAQYGATGLGLGEPATSKK